MAVDDNDDEGDRTYCSKATKEREVETEPTWMQNDRLGPSVDTGSDDKDYHDSRRILINVTWD